MPVSLLNLNENSESEIYGWKVRTESPLTYRRNLGFGKFGKRGRQLWDWCSRKKSLGFSEIWEGEEPKSRDWLFRITVNMLEIRENLAQHSSILAFQPHTSEESWSLALKPWNCWNCGTLKRSILNWLARYFQNSKWFELFFYELIPDIYLISDSVWSRY